MPRHRPLLLRDADGRWVVCTATWNDPAKDVELSRFTALVQRSIELAEAGRPALPAEGAGKK